MLDKHSKPHSPPCPTIDGPHKGAQHLKPAKVYTSHPHEVMQAVLKFQGRSNSPTYPGLIAVPFVTLTNHLSFCNTHSLPCLDSLSLHPCLFSHLHHSPPLTPVHGKLFHQSNDCNKSGEHFWATAETHLCIFFPITRVTVEIPACRLTPFLNPQLLVNMIL